MNRLRTLFIAAAAVVAIAAVPLVAASVSSTQASWSDRTHVSAPVTAGTWVTAPPVTGCTAMTAKGEVIKGGTCTVNSITFLQWSDGKNVVRDYNVSITLSDGAGYAALNVDLSKATGSGDWKWGTAATVPTGQFTPLPGFKCSELPTLRANGPTNWGTTYGIFVRVIENAATPMGAERNCA